MAVDYDLVILGATEPGYSAAIAAAQAYGRVAWVVEQPLEIDPLLLLREGARLVSQHPEFAHAEFAPAEFAYSERLSFAHELLASALESPAAAVQTAGVHYIEGAFQLESSGLAVAGQELRSRAYLLALNRASQMPDIPGINHPRVWTTAQLYEQLVHGQLAQVLQASNSGVPQVIGILGAGPQAVEIGHSLQRLGASLGFSVVLLTNGQRLLPQEDAEAAFTLQTYLEGCGVSIDTQSSLLAVHPHPDGLTLEMGQQNSDRHKRRVSGLVIIPEPSESPESPGLSGALPPSIALLNLHQTPQGLWVNAALQTSIPSVYACGGLLGGYQIPSVGCYEAQLAVQNALFERQTSCQYFQLPYAILSDPPLARVGFTERQALRYCPETHILRQTYRASPRAVLAQVPAGFCKVLVQPDGKLLGAHLVGTEAPELIHVFALAIQQGVPLQALGTMGYVSPTFSQVIQSVAADWRRSRFCCDRNERWFYKRRNATKSNLSKKA